MFKTEIPQSWTVGEMESFENDMAESDIPHTWQERELEDPTQKAETLLSVVGLRLEDLKDKNLVVDVGAGDCYIQDYARRKGMFNVLSVDKNFPSRISRLVLNKLETDARAIDLPDSSTDLIISRSGPLLLEKSREKAIQILEELNRILSSEGEHHIHPARLGFIENDLMSNDDSFADLAGKAPVRRTSMDLDKLVQYRLQANKASQEFLSSQGYEFSVGTIIDNPNLSTDLQNYLVLKKKNVN